MQALQALKPESLKRYKDIIALLVKYGRSDLVRQTGLHAVVGQREPGLTPATAPKAEELANDLEKLGPTFIKLGQLLSTRGDLLRELDFQREASNLIRLHHSLRQFENIIVPQPIEDFTTSRVLTMDYIPGKNIANLSPLRLLEIDGAKLSEELFRAYLKQILID